MSLLGVWEEVNLEGQEIIKLVRNYKGIKLYIHFAPDSSPTDDSEQGDSDCRSNGQVFSDVARTGLTIFFFLLIFPTSDLQLHSCQS
jgi:hypothetical protein